VEIPAMRDEEQKPDQAKPANKDVISESTSVAEPATRSTGERAKLVRKDARAAQKLARKKRLKTAHRRRLRASHTKG